MNAYHNWTAKLEPGRRFVFRARTTVPKVKVGEWSALPDDEDASSNDITDIYNHCRATSTEPGGSLVVVDRYSYQQTGAKSEVTISPIPDNPSADVNTTGWTDAAGTVARTTTAGEYDTAPGAIKWTPNIAGSTLTATFTGTFKKGNRYTLTMKNRCFGGTVGTPVQFGSATDYDTATFTYPNSSTFGTNAVSWLPSADTSTVTFRATGNGLLGNLCFDSLVLTRSVGTILDNRARVRSQILDATAALPADGVALTRLADTWLAAHMTTPFKGKQAIQGPQSARDYLNGDPVAPERLLAMTTDLLHFDDRTNPDTGDVGRDGRLVKVSYQPATDTAQTDVDSTRSDFGALLARIGVLASS